MSNRRGTNWNNYSPHLYSQLQRAACWTYSSDETHKLTWNKCHCYNLSSQGWGFKIHPCSQNFIQYNYKLLEVKVSSCPDSEKLHAPVRTPMMTHVMQACTERSDETPSHYLLEQFVGIWFGLFHRAAGITALTVGEELLSLHERTGSHALNRRNIKQAEDKTGSLLVWLQRSMGH